MATDVPGKLLDALKQLISAHEFGPSAFGDEVNTAAGGGYFKV